MNSKEREKVRHVLNCIQVSVSIQKSKENYNPFVGLEILMTKKLFEMIEAFNREVVCFYENGDKTLFGLPVHVVVSDSLTFWIAADRITFQEEREYQKRAVPFVKPEEAIHDP